MSVGSRGSDLLPLPEFVDDVSIHREPFRSSRDAPIGKATQAQAFVRRFNTLTPEGASLVCFRKEKTPPFSPKWSVSFRYESAVTRVLGQR